MKTRTKVILASLGAALVFGPFLVPVQTSGTLTSEEALATVPGLEENFVEVLDHRVHYEIAGDLEGPRLILLLHGFGASSFSWEKVIEALAQGGSLAIAYDRAGFGFSDRPTNWKGLNPYSSAAQLEVIDFFVESFGSGKEVILVGHSAGGALAAQYALENPTKVSKLVLAAPAIGTGGGIPSWLGFALGIPQINHLGPALVSTIASSGLDILYSSYDNPDLIGTETLNGYTAPLKIAGWERGFWEFVKAPKTSDLEIDALQTPTLIITGDNDLIVPTENSVKLSQTLSKIAQLVVIENSGHLPNEENPEEFIEAVRSFLD